MRLLYGSTVTASTRRLWTGLLSMFPRRMRKRIRPQAKRVAREMADTVYRELVRSPAARAASVRKPVLKRLSVRLDRYDASVDFDTWTVTVKLRDRVFRLRLPHRRDYPAKFAGRRWYEVIVKWLPGARIVVVIPFRFDYQPYKPRRVLAAGPKPETSHPLRRRAHYGG